MAASGSYFVDRRAAVAAVQMALPAIEQAMTRKEVGESGFLHIVVMDPLRTPADCSFEEAILYEHSIGDRARWDADYQAFARAKTRIAWRTGMDSHEVQELHPHLLTEKDTVLWGSVALDGIVVGASGCNPWYDEAFCGIIAMCLRAMVKADATAEREKNLFLKDRER
jgi:hypothetical protein